MLVGRGWIQGVLVVVGGLPYWVEPNAGDGRQVAAVLVGFRRRHLGDAAVTALIQT